MAGSIETKAISASNLKLKLTEAVNKLSRVGVGVGVGVGGWLDQMRLRLSQLPT